MIVPWWWSVGLVGRGPVAALKGGSRRSLRSVYRARATRPRRRPIQFTRSSVGSPRRPGRAVRATASGPAPGTATNRAFGARSTVRRASAIGSGDASPWINRNGHLTFGSPVSSVPCAKCSLIEFHVRSNACRNGTPETVQRCSGRRSSTAKPSGSSLRARSRSGFERLVRRADETTAEGFSTVRRWRRSVIC